MRRMVCAAAKCAAAPPATAGGSVSATKRPASACRPRVKLVLQLERKAQSELSPRGARNGGAARIDEAARMTESGSRGDVVVVVVAVIGAIGQVERLRDQL